MHETGKNTIFGLGPGLAKHIIQIFIHHTAMNIYHFHLIPQAPKLLHSPAAAAFLVQPASSKRTSSNLIGSQNVVLHICCSLCWKYSSAPTNLC